jgi:hypothetical protein
MTTKPDQAIAPRDYHEVIARVAAVKDLDVEKLAKLMALQEEWERRSAATHYNEMMASAQAAMTTISRDSVNPVTRSRYASLAALDLAIRPIYTRFGFSVEFNDETPSDRPDWLKLVAYVSCGAETRKRDKWIPVVTTGLGGRQAMTSTHAAIAAVTYGRRALLKMVFNLAEDDDDGNLDRGRTPQRSESTDDLDREPGTVKPIVNAEEALAKMNACETWPDLKKYGDELLRLNIFPGDRAGLVDHYNKLREAFEAKAKAKTEAAT